MHAYLDSLRKSLTDTSGRYVIWIEGPTILANAISLVTVSLTECMFAASHLITRCFETIKFMYNKFFYVSFQYLVISSLAKT